MGEQRVVKAIRELREKGMSLRQVAQYMSSTGVPTKRRGQQWHPEMVRRVLGRTDPDGQTAVTHKSGKDEASKLHPQILGRIL
ncbi:MAG: recombinase family protein [Pseudomonadota bacterium]|nr:recombinase family protein [Pseudomonadota bacterium]